jgi:hypothetical protein
VKSFVLLLSSVFFYLISPVSYAKNNSDLLLNLTHCSTISSDNARLACFDKFVPDSTKQNVVTPTVIVSASVDNQLTEQKQVDDFAKEHLKETKEEQGSSSLYATVSEIKKSLRGQWIIYLENGQKWQQKDKASIKLTVGNKVRLEKGAMGSIYLYKDGSHRSIKVRRLK